MPNHASGTFEVKLSPQPNTPAEEQSLGRLLLDKQFVGDLHATSLGQMLAARTPVEASAGYVALERVTGTLHGRRGSFVLQHSGLLTRGVGSLTITVVPDSGTDELAGLAGSMTIDVEAGHAYAFEYTLEATAA